MTKHADGMPVVGNTRTQPTAPRGPALLQDILLIETAPATMAWQGLTPPQICVQLKDRRGKPGTAKMLQHSTEDKVVGMVWNFGTASPPGTQKEYGELMKAWLATGGHCPRIGEARGKH